MMLLENNRSKCKIWNLQLFLSSFSHCRVKGFSAKHSIESRCYRSEKVTVSRCICASFSPEILQAGSVKGLKVYNQGGMLKACRWMLPFRGDSGGQQAPTAPGGDGGSAVHRQHAGATEAGCPSPPSAGNTWCRQGRESNRLFMAPCLVRPWSAYRDTRICSVYHTQAHMHAHTQT